MKLPRDLSGNEVVKVLCRSWDYQVIHQEGSHIVLETDTPAHQRISVPAHRLLRVGTLNAIIRAVSTHKHVSREDVLQTLP